jgi:hypothetical protein
MYVHGVIKTQKFYKYTLILLHRTLLILTVYFTV